MGRRGSPPMAGFGHETCRDLRALGTYVAVWEQGLHHHTVIAPKVHAISMSFSRPFRILHEFKTFFWSKIATMSRLDGFPSS